MSAPKHTAPNSVNLNVGGTGRRQTESGPRTAPPFPGAARPSPHWAENTNFPAAPSPRSGGPCSSFPGARTEEAAGQQAPDADTVAEPKGSEKSRRGTGGRTEKLWRLDKEQNRARNLEIQCCNVHELIVSSLVHSEAVSTYPLNSRISIHFTLHEFSSGAFEFSEKSGSIRIQFSVEN